MIDKCNNCGQCCYYEDEGIMIPCPYLKRLSNNKTRCLIYGRRLYRHIATKSNGEKVFCFRRIDMKKHLEGCPYNSDIEVVK